MLKSFKRLPLAAALVAASLTPVAHGAEWSDAFIGVAQGSKFREPGNPLENEKTVATAQYVGGYKYGVNFFTVDMLQSGPNDLARGSKRPAQEVYAVYNNTVSLGKLGMDTKFGLIRDIGFQAGFDFNSKNDAFGAGTLIPPCALVRSGASTSTPACPRLSKVGQPGPGTKAKTVSVATPLQRPDAADNSARSIIVGEKVFSDFIIKSL
ncbi:MAG: hypothetical protein EBU34_09775 [Alphaproteobacteria bacterium]|nr:hypothetical protein [Alphaproteobacteria bacterium]